jgi:hypothetical protein
MVSKHRPKPAVQVQRREDPRRRILPAFGNSAPGDLRQPYTRGKVWVNHPEFDRGHPTMDYCPQNTHLWPEAGPRWRYCSSEQLPEVRRISRTKLSANEGEGVGAYPRE